MIEVQYVEDLGWPWTSDKCMLECELCHAGGVFGRLDDTCIRVHKHCLKDLREREEKKR